MIRMCIALLAGLLAGELAAKPNRAVAKQFDSWVNLLEKSDSGIGLKHWRMVNVAPKTFYFGEDPKSAGEEVLICTGKPTGVIRSAEVYENFLVEFEWRHMELDGMRANAGFFVWSDALPAVAIPFSRSIEVQVANFEKEAKWFTRHGDIFPIHGSKMTPDPRFAQNGSRSLPLEYRAKGTAEWNHYRILCIAGTIQLEVNGKVVSGGYQINPRKGHLMIESEGGEVHFRNMRVLELESSDGDLPAKSVAKTLPADVTVTPLYNGLDLDGWMLSDGAKFKATDCRISAEAGEATRKLERLEGRLLVDWSSKDDLDKFPVSIGVESMDMAVKKGRHRLEIDLASGAWKIDGKPQPEKWPIGEPTLTLHGLGAKGHFANVLHISK